MRGCVLPLLLSAAGAAAPPLVQLVDTRIGGGGVGFGIGSVNPAAQAPFGALRLGPDTTSVLPIVGQLYLPFNHFGGYYYNDTHVRAFSHTHTDGAGVTDWGTHGVIVVRESPPGPSLIHNSTTNTGYMSAYRQETEVAQPGYYSVVLDSAQTTAELSFSGTHSGAHRYSCTPGSSASLPCTVLIDACHTVSIPVACKVANVSISLSSSNSSTVVVRSSVLNAGGLSGRSPNGGVWVHFYAEIEAVSAASTGAAASPKFGVWTQNTVLPAASSGGPSSASIDTGAGQLDNLGAWITLGGTPAGATQPLVVVMRVGISFVDPLHAQQNLYADQAVGGVGAMASTGPSTYGSSAVDGHRGADWGGPWAADFDGLVAAAQEEWEQWLNRTQIVAPSPSPEDGYPLAATFPSATYRALLAPTTYSEWDGAYLGMDGAIHAVLHPASGAAPAYGADSPAPPLYRYVSDMSLWDVHRSQMPWLSLVAPEVAADVTRSLLTMTAQGGHLPRWPMANVYTGCMDGSHGIAVMTDTLLKCVPGVGTGGADGNSSGSLGSLIFGVARDAVEAQAAGNRYGTLGYVPTEDSDSAGSSTLEYGYDDGIAAVLANATGNGNWSAFWAARSAAYQKIWDFATVSACPKTANGSFRCPLLPILPYPIQSGYTEGDGLQWQWAVQHDLPGLASFGWKGNSTAYALDLHGFMANQVLWPLVVDTVSDALPNAFYWAGNEPDILAPWQFPAGGAQFVWLTQFWTRWLLRYYSVYRADGIPGNDDYGTMSAWASWAALGLYPLAGTDLFVLGSPSVTSATIALPTGAGGTLAPQLSIVVHNASAANIYVSSVLVNGAPVTSAGARGHGPNRAMPGTVSFAQLLPALAAPCTASSSAADGSSAAGLLEFFMADVPTEWGTGRVLSPEELAPFKLPAWPQYDAAEATHAGWQQMGTAARWDAMTEEQRAARVAREAAFAPRAHRWVAGAEGSEGGAEGSEGGAAAGTPHQRPAQPLYRPSNEELLNAVAVKNFGGKMERVAL